MWNSSARSRARLDAAETPQTRERPATAAFWTISKETSARDQQAELVDRPASRGEMTDQLVHRIVPPHILSHRHQVLVRLECGSGVIPPVERNAGCSSMRRPGKPSRVSRVTTGPSGGTEPATRMASIEALTDAARRRGVEVALETGGIDPDAVGEPDIPSPFTQVDHRGHVMGPVMIPSVMANPRASSASLPGCA